jgi:hypothetical protein
MQNLWEKDRKRLFRELYHQYLDEGYDQKEAKKLAKQEADEIMSDSAEFAMDVAMKDERDDY